MIRLYVLFIPVLSLLLVACASNPVIVTDQPGVQPTAVSPAQTLASPIEISEAQPPQSADTTASELPELTDSQGAVEVLVRPLDLGSQASKLIFKVALNTHSIDLSMDLAKLATLTTDTGYTVQANVWDAPLGGHHVSGTLSFPSSVDGKAILDSAAKLTLTIEDVDAPERTFVWDLR